MKVRCEENFFYVILLNQRVAKSERNMRLVTANQQSMKSPRRITSPTNIF